jgi:hypothetical protein
MSNKVKQIDLLNRNSLILLGKKLQIPGYKNNFTSPYRNMDYLKNAIQNGLKDLKKRNRRNSVQDSSNSNLEKPTKYQNIKRSQSLPNLNSQTYTIGNKTGNPISLSKNDLLGSNDSCVFPPKRKLVAIGDIHGDLSLAIRSLKLAQVIDSNTPNNLLDVSKIQWTGGDTFVVQLGDQIDRVRPSKLFNSLCTEDDDELYEDEGSDLKIIYLFEHLNKQAVKQNGAVISILGNHELMNVDGDFRYVSPKEFREFGNKFNGRMEYNTEVPFGYKERLEVFKPGGVLARSLGKTRYSVVQVGSWIFVHGGITGVCAKDYSLQKINYHIKRWLLGDLSNENMQHVNNLYHRDDDENSPFWSRVYSDMDEWCNESIKEFSNTMNMINVWNNKNNDFRAHGIIMGHSPQFMYGQSINSSLNNRIWRVDVGASRAFGKLTGPDAKHRLAQVLVILNDGRNPEKDFQIVKEKGG